MLKGFALFLFVLFVVMGGLSLATVFVLDAHQQWFLFIAMVCAMSAAMSLYARRS